MRRPALCSGNTFVSDLLRRFTRPWSFVSIAILVGVVILAPSTSNLALAQPGALPIPQQAPDADDTFAPGRVLIGWDSPSDTEAARAAVQQSGWTLLRSLAPLPAAVVEVPVGKEQEAIARLQADPAIAYAELDTLVFATGNPSRVHAVDAAGFQPNDPNWEQQWAPRRIKAPEAWEVSTGGSQVVVAVVDSGIDLAHPEFAGRLLPGFDYVQWDTQPQDEYGHGTHVSGIIAAAGNNQEGVAGLAWQAKILPLRVLDRNGAGTASSVASAISNAANQRASVVNLSLALSGPNETVLNAILYARGTGAIVVASAGNDTPPGQAPAPVRYPARYAEVIAVSASTHWDEWAPYSNGGPEVDFAAPGGESSDPILSTGLSGSTAQLYGTSMAAAHVSGVVALLRSQAPSIPQGAVEEALRATADKIGSYPYSGGRNDRFGYGRVQAAGALRWAIAPMLRFTPDSPTLLVDRDQMTASLEIQLANPSGQPLRWQVVTSQPGWLTAGPSSGTGLAYPGTATLRIGIASTPPLGLTYASVVVRTTTSTGQQNDSVISIRVVATPELRFAFVPAVGSEALTPAWQDLVNNGIGLALEDDGTQPVSLPFAFPFYGRWYTQVWVNANGFLSLERGYSGTGYASNGCVPSLFSPNGAIYALWDDLDPSVGGRVAYGRTADGGFAVEWRDVPNKTAGLNTFQVILHPTGQITQVYRWVSAPNSATTGLENWDASLSWQESCNGVGAPPVSGSMQVLRAALPGQ